MPRLNVGYQDGGVYPLWLANMGFRVARLFGAESLWLPDHYMGFISPLVWKPEYSSAAKIVHSPDGFFDPMQLLAVASTRYRGIDLGTAVTEAFRKHPMTLAQSFVTLDHLSRGHAILGIGNGERENVEPYGLPWEKQVARLEEALAIIRKLWHSKGNPVDYDGKIWKLKDAVFNLPLYKDTPPRIWVAAHAPRMLALTGRFADGWLPTMKVEPSEYARRLAVIKSAGEEHGRDMSSFVPSLLVIVALGENRDKVSELSMKSRVAAAMSLLAPSEVWKSFGKTHPLGENHRGWLDIVPPRVTEEQIQAAAGALTPELLSSQIYMGSPEQIRDELAPMVSAGCRNVIISNVGGAITGAGASDLWRLGSLIRKLRRIPLN